MTKWMRLMRRPFLDDAWLYNTMDGIHSRDWFFLSFSFWWIVLPSYYPLDEVSRVELYE